MGHEQTNRGGLDFERLFIRCYATTIASVHPFFNKSLFTTLIVVYLTHKHKKLLNLSQNSYMQFEFQISKIVFLFRSLHNTSRNFPYSYINNLQVLQKYTSY